jgi:hypothetical protein
MHNEKVKKMFKPLDAGVIPTNPSEEQLELSETYKIAYMVVVYSKHSIFEECQKIHFFKYPNIGDSFWFSSEKQRVGSGGSHTSDVKEISIVNGVPHKHSKAIQIVTFSGSVYLVADIVDTQISWRTAHQEQEWLKKVYEWMDDTSQPVPKPKN